MTVSPNQITATWLFLRSPATTITHFFCVGLCQDPVFRLLSAPSFWRHKKISCDMLFLHTHKRHLDFYNKNYYNYTCGTAHAVVVCVYVWGTFRSDWGRQSKITTAIFWKFASRRQSGCFFHTYKQFYAIFRQLSTYFYYSFRSGQSNNFSDPLQVCNFAYPPIPNRTLQLEWSYV